MKKIKMTLRIDYKAMKFYNMYNLIYRKHFLWFYVALAFLCLVGALINVAPLVITSWTREPNVLLAAIFLLFTGYLIYQITNLEKIVDRNISQYFYNRNPIEQYMTITEESITIASPSDPAKQVTYDWISVTKIHEIREYYYLYLGKQPIIIAKDPNVILEGEYDDLIAIVQEKIKGKPYKKVDKIIVRRPITFVHQIFNEEVKEVADSDVELHDTEELLKDVETVVEDASQEEATNTTEENKNVE